MKNGKGERIWRATCKSGPDGLAMNTYEVVADRIEDAAKKVRKVCKNTGTETIIAIEQIAFLDA